MGTLGQYLHDARVAKDIDLRDAAQQTRISIQYLRALEDEDFSKLPGEVFVKGFLKNYGRFLNLDEAEVMKRYAELKPQSAPPSAAAPDTDNPVVLAERETRKQIPIEPFVWGAVIVISLLVLLFTSLPAKLPKNTQQQPVGSTVPAVMSRETLSAQDMKPEKLYLEVVAIEDTWLLVRIDASPQKKAVLKRGESLIWSADERFLLSYGQVGAVKLLLNGEELTVQGTRESAVRDLVITRAGIVNQPLPARPPQRVRSKPQPPAQPQQAQPQAEEKPAAPAQPSAAPDSAPVKASPRTPLTPSE
jgi:hypothetical protein